MELNKDIMKLKGDEKIAAADKTAKLAELEKQFAELGHADRRAARSSRSTRC